MNILLHFYWVRFISNLYYLDERSNSLWEWMLISICRSSLCIVMRLTNVGLRSDAYFIATLLDYVPLMSGSHRMLEVTEYVSNIYSFNAIGRLHMLLNWLNFHLLSWLLSLFRSDLKTLFEIILYFPWSGLSWLYFVLVTIILLFLVIYANEHSRDKFSLRGDTQHNLCQKSEKIHKIHIVGK